MVFRLKLFPGKAARRQICLAALVVLFIFLGTAHYIFSAAAFVLCCYAMFFMENSYFLSLLFLIMPMASIFKLTPGTTSLFTYLELLYVLWHIVRNRFKISVGELLAMFFLGYIVITGSLYTSLSITRTLKIVINLMIIRYVTDFDPEKHHKTVFFCFYLGIVASSLIRLADSSFFPIVEYVAEHSEKFMGVMKARFSGLYSDPNYYSVNVIIAMCLLIALYRRRELSFSTAVWLNVPLVIFVGMTGSKSSFLMLMLPILLIFYVSVKNHNYWALLFCILGIGILAVLVFSGEIEMFNYVLLRLRNTTSSLDAFTTGRTEIWREYFRFLKKRPLWLLFGTGSSIFLLDGTGAHNTYVDLLYQFGIIGTAMYLSTMVCCIGNRKKRIKKSVINYSVWITVLVMYVFLSELLYIDLPFHVSLACWVYSLKMQKTKQNGGGERLCCWTI